MPSLNSSLIDYTCPLAVCEPVEQNFQYSFRLPDDMFNSLQIDGWENIYQFDALLPNFPSVEETTTPPSLTDSYVLP